MASASDQFERSLPERPRPPSEFAPLGQRRCFLCRFLEPLFSGYTLKDILSSRYHSDDFVETRAEYILVRLRFLLLFYAISVPAWLPFDYLTLNHGHFLTMIAPRLAMPAFLVLLGSFAMRPLTNRQVHFALILTFLASCIFYFVTTRILSHGGPDNDLAGYNAMPFLMVAMIGVFPLTLAFGAVLISLVTASYIGVEMFVGHRTTVDVANTLWVLLLLGGIALWVQSSQLLMLLKLYRESTQDPLTRLINRRALMRRLNIEINHRGEHDVAFFVAMFDLDRFKRINDKYGHLIGDKVLKTTAALLQSGLQEPDVAARFGGEEFVAVLAECRRDQVLAIVDHIRRRCHDTKLLAPNGDLIQLDVSAGVTDYRSPETIETTLSRADEALYQAKLLGRNRIVYCGTDG